MLEADAKRELITLPVLASISTIFLALRLSRKKRKLGLDDWLLCVALFLEYLQVLGGILLAIKGGEGKQMVDLSPNELSWLLKMEYWPELAYTIAIAMIKTSVLLSYNWIFGRLKWFRYATSTVGALTMIWFIGVFFSVLFQCIPIDKVWQPTKPGHCIDFVPFLWGNSISNTILDYMILLLPVIPVLNLQMETVQKVLVLLSFSLGSLAAISSTLRAAKTKTVDVTNLSATIFEDSVWTYVEPNAGILSACLPYLANVFGRRILQMVQFVSSFGSKTKSLLRLYSRTEYGSKDSKTAERSTPRATHEAYELNKSDHEIAAIKVRDISHESVRNLV